MGQNYAKANKTKAKARQKAKCKKKVSYETLEDADKAAHWQGMVPYTCPFCHKYHVGHISLHPLRHR